VIARYRQEGAAGAQRFSRLSQAYEFLAQQEGDGDLAVIDIEAEGGSVIVSYDAFQELKKLDQLQRDGWLAVLARAHMTEIQ
jgi:hypothetical protein